MINDALTLDQLAVFATVAEKGSFSSAARALGRAQSAVTYAIQKLESETGVPLFDRSAYRPVLSEAGRALLPRARRILEAAETFRSQARGIAGGLEPEISLVVDAMFPMARLVAVLGAFQARFPTVQTRVAVETLGATVQAILDGEADLGLILHIDGLAEGLELAAVTEVELVPVAAPGHPLAKLPGPLSEEVLREQVQLVMTDRSPRTAGRDHGVFALQTWRLADLGAKHAMLLAGLGWGSMPAHMVEADLADGRLVRLTTTRWDGAAEPPRLQALAAHVAGRTLGPAGRWLFAALARRAEVGASLPPARAE